MIQKFHSKPTIIFLSLTLLLALFAPAPFGFISPGPATNLLQAKFEVVKGSLAKPQAVKGRLFSTSVYVNDPTIRPPGFQVLAAWISGRDAVVPWSAIYPAGQDSKTSRKISALEMQNSQVKAALAAANFIKSMDPTMPLAWKPSDISFAMKSVGGPSAGLAFALTVITKLKAPDLIAGRSVAVTGEITESGLVGRIGGIDQKIIGAKEAGAKIFILPKENCQDLTRTPKGVKLIAVSTLSQAVHALADSRIADSLHC